MRLLRAVTCIKNGNNLNGTSARYDPGLQPNLSLETQTTKQALRWKLQQELEAHERAAVRNRRELNSLSDIFSLPPELLVIIFEFYLLQCPQQEPDDWAALTHVCSYWRDIALSTPRLWTTIVLPAKPRFLSAKLKRSGNAILDVDVKRDPPGYEDALEREQSALLELVFEQIHRIGRLDIRCPSLRSSRCLPEPVDAPQLRILHCNQHTWFPDAHILLRLRSLPKLESLTTISTRDVLIHLRNSYFPCLKNLTFTRPYHGNFHHSLLADVLRGLPLLESLCTPWGFIEDGPLVTQLTLPNLKFLRIFDWSCTRIPACANLLSRLVIPDALQIDASRINSFDGPGDHTTADIWRTLAPQFTGSKPLLAVGFNLVSMGPVLHGWTDAVRASDYQCPKFSLAVGIGKNMIRIVPCFDLSSVRTLYLSNCLARAHKQEDDLVTIMHQLDLAAVLPHLRNVEEIRLDYVSPSQVCKLLDMGPTDEPAFPNLRVLRLDYLNVYRCSRRVHNRHYCDTGCINVFTSMLKKRNNAKNPIARLELASNFEEISSQSLTAIKAVVGHVELVVSPAPAPGRRQMVYGAYHTPFLCSDDVDADEGI